MGFPVRTIDGLLNCLDSKKKDWCLVLLLDRENPSQASSAMMNLLSDFDEDSADNFDFFLPGYSENTIVERYERRGPIYEGVSLACAPIVKIERIGELYFSRQDFRVFYKTLEKLSPNRWRYSGDCELVLFKRNNNEKIQRNDFNRVEFVDFCSYNLDDIIRNGQQPNQFVRRLCNTIKEPADTWMSIKTSIDSVYSELIMPSGGMYNEDQNRMLSKARTEIDKLGVGSYIFISYSSADYKIADSVRKSLEYSGIKCWMAPYNIPVGTSYAYMIEDSIKKCAMFLLLLSEKSMNSIWVEKELLFAMEFLQQKNRIFVAWCTEPIPLSRGFGFSLANIQIDNSILENGNTQNVVVAFFGDGLPNSETSHTSGWIKTMKCNPELIDKEEFFKCCPWSRFNGEEWLEVLTINDSLVGKIPFDTLSAEASAKLISKYPKLIDRCNWEKISSSFPWGKVKKLPNLLSYFPFKDANAESWIKLLRTGVQVPNIDWEYINDIFSSEDWVRLLVAMPSYLSECRKLEQLTGEQWTFLLSRKPELVTGCDLVNGWEKLTELNRRHILKHVPGLASKLERNI